MPSDKVIFGIDIAKGSPGAKQHPRYAVAILTGSGIEHHKMVSLHKIIRMVWQQRPHILAVDNFHELTPGRQDLIALMRKFPPGTRLVQVTGGEHPKSLTSLARNHNLSFDRLDPNQEAETCAVLASMDVGAEVLLFEDKTYIKVSRARSLGRGGWSQNRYRRKVHGHVRQKTREIEDTLRTLNREQDLNYSSSIVKGFGGYVRGEFLVDAPRGCIPIKQTRLGDVQVRVQDVERDALVFCSLKENKRKTLIVGIDPGTTTGLGMLDLEGNLVKSHSGRGMSVSDIVEMIARYGKPMIIATDVRPMPGTVEKIRRSFNAIPGEPDESLSSEYKINLARPYGYRNDHERDAIAASAHVFRRHKNKFEEIRKRIPPGIDADEVIVRVMKGDTIDSAVAGLSGRIVVSKPHVEEPAIQEPDEVTADLRKTIKRQHGTINSLRTYLDELKSEITTKKHRISALDRKIKKFKSDSYATLRKSKEMRIRDEKIRNQEHELHHKDRRIEELTELVEELKRLRNLEISGRAIPVKVASAFTKEAIAHVKEQYGINAGDVLFFKDASGGGPATVDMLSQAGVMAVIFRGDMAHNAQEEFLEKNLPFFNVKSVPVNYLDDMGVVDPDDFNPAFEKFNEESKARKRKEKEQLLSSLVEEYKSERRRGIE
ncbi:MAG: DUF460 domain-containing protein [ANME-2 cluster archaeon]|jgi:predicted RNase H-like nuclease (RuvC/YqgF family)|nr:DUF460 domain-containing protein [ANME-2 cluster archaeon]